MNIEYVQIPDFPAYRVCNQGFIETRWRTGPFYNGFEVLDIWKKVKNKERPEGYINVDLRDGRGKSRRTYVHILVAELFVGQKPFKGACVRHLDGNARNNNFSNLAWGTYAQNENDKKAHGTWEARYTGKLTDNQRQQIRDRISKGERQSSIAEEYGVSRPTITRLINGTTWSIDK